MLAWEANKAWSDRFMGEVKQIVGPKMLDIAPLEIDQKQAGDLVLLRGRNSTIAVRIRRFGFLPKYANEFTIRFDVPSGFKTEYEKIANGFGDLFFYAHSDEAEVRLVRWMLIDLNAFRSHLILSRDPKTGRTKFNCGSKSNPDGTQFRWFDASTFPPDPKLVLYQSHDFVRSEAA
jgi:hypothetical protein